MKQIHIILFLSMILTVSNLSAQMLTDTPIYLGKKIQTVRVALGQKPDFTTEIEGTTITSFLFKEPYDHLLQFHSLKDTIYSENYGVMVSNMEAAKGICIAFCDELKGKGFTLVEERDGAWLLTNSRLNASVTLEYQDRNKKYMCWVELQFSE